MKKITVTNAADYSQRVNIVSDALDTLDDAALKGARKLRIFGRVYGVKADSGHAYRYYVLGKPDTGGTQPIIGTVWTN